MLSLSPLIAVILIAHYISDFPLQNSWMALNKSKRLLPLVIHILVYTTALTTITALGALALGLSIEWVLMWGVLNGAAHFGVDFVTSRLSSKAWAEKKINVFWLVIGFDQLLHVLCLLFLV